MTGQIASGTPLWAALGIALATGCGGSAAALGDMPTLSGQVISWTKGPATVMVTVSAKVDGAVVDQTIATGPIDAAGNFSVTLPGQAQLAPDFLPFESPCPGVALNPAGALGAAFSSLNTSVGVRLILADIIIPSTHIIYGHYTYSDRAESIQGTSSSTTCNLQFSAGWNTFTIDTNSAGPVGSSFISGPIPADVKWQVLK